MSRRFMSINLAKPIETVEQFPFVLCAWPSFADQPYINNYRIYDDRVGETTRFTYRPDPRVVLVPPAKADRGLTIVPSFWASTPSYLSPLTQNAKPKAIISTATKTSGASRIARPFCIKCSSSFAHIGPIPTCYR
jgi:hypothetical protein